MEKKEHTGLSINHIMRYTALAFICFLVFSCRQDSPALEVIEKKEPVTIPSTNADSLYSFVNEQVGFGHRYPSASGHAKIREWIKLKMTGYGATVTEQPFKVSFYDVKDADAFNIIASINPKHNKRILLAAHYDSRIVAEKDPDKSKENDPILGADDGASGVSVLIEIARVVQQNPIDLGIDFIFFDAEDNGKPQSNNTWCLGSQYWSKNPHKRDYKATFGILFDMVGAKGASFPKEGVSQRYAKKYQDKIWTLAQRMGYGDYFIDQQIDGLVDDHLHVNQKAGIPMLDIINYDIASNGFASYHHTHNDNLSIIDKRTLRVVTQVALATLYKTSDLTL